MGLKKNSLLISLYIFCLFCISLSTEKFEQNNLNIIEQARVYLNNSSVRNRSRRNHSRSKETKHDVNESIIVNEKPDEELLTLIEPFENEHKEDYSHVNENHFSNLSTGITHNHTHTHTHTHNHTHSHNHSYVRTRSINKTIPEALDTTVPEPINQDSHEGIQPQEKERNKFNNNVMTNKKTDNMNESLAANDEKENVIIENLISLKRRSHDSSGKHHNEITYHNNSINEVDMNQSQNNLNGTELIKESLTLLSYNLSSETIKNHVAADRLYNSKIFMQRSYEDLNYQNTSDLEANNSNSIDTTYNKTRKYIFPRNRNLTHRQREKMRNNLEKQAQHLRKTAHYAIKKLRKEYEDSNQRMNKLYKSLKNRYRNREDRKKAFKKHYEQQRQRIKESYNRAEDRIRENAECSLDKLAIQNGFDISDNTNDLTPDQYYLEETLNQTLNEELNHLEDVKNEELQNLDNAYNKVSNTNHLQDNNNKNTSTSNNITYLLLSSKDLDNKRNIYGKIHKENYKAVILLLMVLLICASLSIMINWKKKKHAINKKLDDAQEGSTYVLMR